MSTGTLPEALARRLRALHGQLAQVIEWIERRQRILAEMRALGEQIDALYQRSSAQPLSEQDACDLMARQNAIQGQIEKRRQEADAALGAAGGFFEAVERALWEAATHQPSFLAAAQAFRSLAPGRSADAKRLLAETLEVRKLLQEVLAPEESSARAEAESGSVQAADQNLGLWTVRQAANRLGLSEKTIYRMAGLGRMPHTRVGRSLRFRPQDVEDWIARQSLVPKRR